ncbi:MAG: hypothetical protein IJS20_02395 [Bacteroidales bacterium]|nr:hypothetical protein [Bacteroidales bacterium]
MKKKFFIGSAVLLLLSTSILIAQEAFYSYNQKLTSSLFLDDVIANAETVEVVSIYGEKYKRVKASCNAYIYTDAMHCYSVPGTEYPCRTENGTDSICYWVTCVPNNGYPVY